MLKKIAYLIQWITFDSYPTGVGLFPVLIDDDQWFLNIFGSMLFDI
jgi:hypothetical protein